MCALRFKLWCVVCNVLSWLELTSSRAFLWALDRAAEADPSWGEEI